jgi:hypothetical protein
MIDIKEEKQVKYEEIALEEDIEGDDDDIEDARELVDEEI